MKMYFEKILETFKKEVKDTFTVSCFEDQVSCVVIPPPPFQWCRFLPSLPSLAGRAAWPPPSGGAAFLLLFWVVLVPRIFFLKKTPAQRRESTIKKEEAKQHHPTEERWKSSPSQRMGRKAAPNKGKQHHPKGPRDDPTTPLGTFLRKTESQKKHHPQMRPKGKVGILLDDATLWEATTNASCHVGTAGWARCLCGERFLLFLSVNCSTCYRIQLGCQWPSLCRRICACTREVLGRCKFAAFMNLWEGRK